MCLKAATTSQSPTSVKWEYNDRYSETWRDDPALTVTSLSERPSRECEVRISLTEDITRDMKRPGVAGVYKADGSYSWGKPVFRHSGGVFKLRVRGASWDVRSVVGVRGGRGGDLYLLSGSAPSMCPADPRADTLGSWAVAGSYRQTHWKYRSNQGGYKESGDISVTCTKHKY